MPLGRSSRNEAKAFAMPLSAAVSAGDPVCAPPKVKPPRGPWLSCVCSSLSLLWRQVAPNLTVWFPRIFVSVVANSQVRSQRSHGRLLT